jgi:hypothetical protein
MVTTKVNNSYEVRSEVPHPKQSKKQIKELLKSSFTTVVDGFTHCHFTPTYIGKLIPKLKSIVLSGKEGFVIKKKKKIIKVEADNMSTEEFERLVEEFASNSEEFCQSVLSEEPKTVRSAILLNNLRSRKPAMLFSLKNNTDPETGETIQQVEHQQEGSFVKDLTKEGIHPHPGPVCQCSGELNGVLYYPDQGKWVDVKVDDSKHPDNIKVEEINCEKCNKQGFVYTIFSLHMSNHEIDVIMAAIYRTPFKDFDPYKFVKDTNKRDTEIKIPTTQVHVYSSEENKTFILTNGINFTVPEQYVRMENEHYVLKVSSVLKDDIFGYIKEKKVKFNGKQIIKVKKYQHLNRSTIWANHTNFDPHKRCTVFFKNTIKKIFKTDNFLEQIEGSSEGAWLYASTLLLVPKNSMVFRFSGQVYVDAEVNGNLYNRVLSSVIQQEMTAKHLAEMSVILTQIQFAPIIFEMSYSSIFSIFYLLVNHNMHTLTYGKQVNFTIKEVWDEVFNLRPALQVFDVDLSKSVTTPVQIQKIKKFNISYDSLKQLAEEYFIASTEDMDLEELISLYKSGILPCFENTIKPLKFHSENAIIHFEKEMPQLNEKQRFVKRIVDLNMTEVDITEVFKRVIDISLEDTNKNFLKETLRLIAKFRIDSMYQPGLKKLNEEDIPDIAIEKPNEKYKQKSFMNKNLITEKKIANAASSQYFAYCKIFNVRPGVSPYANLEYVFNLACDRRNPIRLTSLEDEIIDGDDSEDDEPLIGANEMSLKEKFKKPFVMFNNLCSNIYKATGQLANFDSLIKSQVDKVITSFDQVGLTKAATVMKEMNFNTIKDSFNSIKYLITGYFQDFMSKICSLFGVQYNCNIDPFTLFTYYLLWTKSQCPIVQKFIIGMIIIELGIADAFWEIIKNLYNGLKNLMSTPCSKDVDKELEKLEDELHFLEQEQVRLSKEMDKNESRPDSVDKEEEYVKIFNLIKEINTQYQAKIRQIKNHKKASNNKASTSSSRNTPISKPKDKVEKQQTTATPASTTDLRPPTTSEFDQLLKDYENRMVETNKKHQKIIKKVKKEIDSLPSEETSESMLEYIWHKLENATGPILGVLGTTLVATLGLKVAMKDNNKIGEAIIKGARNVSFLALGMGAVPKIFTYVMSALNWLVDEVKGTLSKKHITKAEYIKEVSTFLQEALYIKGILEVQAVRSLTVCVKFMERFATMKKLREKILDLSDHPTLRMEFSKRCQVMIELYPVVKAAAVMHYGQAEICHLQFWSSVPGIGKTDLQHLVMETVQKDFHEMELITAEQMGIRQKRYIEQSSYPLQDNLDHNDAYYDQSFAIIDEDSVMMNPDGAQIISKMQMLSGSPTLSKQADLSGKGRLFRLKLILSNTNNAFLKPHHMPTPSALHRRRILYKVTVNPKYGVLDESKSEYTICPEKIREAEKEEGFNRTKGSHLLFTWLDSVTGHVKNSAAQNLPVDKFLKLVSCQVKEHYNIELTRALNKRPDRCYLRLLFEELMEDLTMDAPEMIPEDLKSSMYDSKTLLKIINKVEESGTAELKEKYQNDLRTYHKMTEFLKPEQDLLGTLNIEEPETRSFFGAVVEELDYKMQKIKIGDNIYWMLAPGQMAIRKGEIDFDRLVLKKYKDHKYVMYKTLPNVTEDVCSIGYWVQRLSSCVSEADFKNEIEICKMEEARTSLKTIYKAKFLNLHNRTLRAIQSVGKYLKEMAIKIIGQPLFQGMIIAVSIYGMFISLHTIGYLLTPPRTLGYAQQSKPLHSYNLSKPIVLTDHSQYVGSSYPVNVDPHPELARKVTYKMRYVQDGIETVGTIIGIKGNIFLTCYHLVHRITKPVMIQIYDPKFEENPQFTIKEFSITPKDIRQIPNKDAALIYIEGFRPVRNALDHFVSEADVNSKDLSFSSGYCISTLLRNKDFSKPTKALWTSTGYGPYTQTTNYRHAKFPDHRTLEFECPTSVLGGDSGSLVLHDNPRIDSKFAGIILSVGLYTYVGMITKEELETTLKKFEIKQQIVTQARDAVLLSDEHPLKNVFKYNDEVYHSPYRNLGISHSLGFRKTKLYGKLDDAELYEVAPAIQHANDHRITPNSRHYLEVALNKTNNEESPSITAEEKTFMIKAYEDQIISNTDFLNTIRIWSTKEAIMGVKYRGSKRLNPHSSPGLPYKLQTNMKGKSEWIRFDEASQTWMIAEYVYNQVEIYEKQLEMGYAPNYEPLEFRKKELVGLKKITNPKTRTVAACNFITQIISNKIFNHLEMLIKNMWDYGKSTPFALGVDPERHWHQIAVHLGEKNWDYVNDYDIDSWESKIVLELITMETQAKLNIIKRAYRSRGEEMPKKWETIAHGIAIGSTDTYVVFEDVMYRKRSGLLSGFPTTFMSNTGMQLMLTSLVSRRILLKYAPQYANVEFIRKNVRFVMAGDDVIIAISPLARQYITFERIQEEYKKLSFKLTAADKSENMQAKTISQVQFLKCYFRDVNGTFVMDPKMNIIHQLLTWVRDEGDGNLYDQIEINIHTAFRYLWWKGKETYDRVRDNFNTLLLGSKYQWSYSYSEMAVAIRQALIAKEERAEVPNAMTNDFEYFSTDFCYD